MAKTASSSCRPPKGTTYLTIGQDLFSIQQYVNEQFNASLHSGSVTQMSTFFPAAVMAYTDLETLRGLDKPVDYGSGVEYADGTIASLFPGYGVGLQIGLWLSGAEGCRKINRGTMDGQIDKLVRYLENTPASRVFLRVGYEFDNPSFGYADDPPEYVLAYRRIADACRAGLSPDTLNRVHFVWHSWGAPTLPDVGLHDFYPGDEYVDWIGVSVFQQLYPWAEYWAGREGDIDGVMQFAASRDKPTMIAESTPFGGIDLNTTETALFGLDDPWDRWFQPVLDLVDKYDVSMFCYINCGWDMQPMWHGIGFGETRLSTSDRVMQMWKKAVLGGEGEGGRKFLAAGSLGDCGGADVAEDDQPSSSTSAGGRMNMLEESTRRGGASFDESAPPRHSRQHRHIARSSGHHRFGNGVGGTAALVAGGAAACVLLVFAVLGLVRVYRRGRAFGGGRTRSRRVRFTDDDIVVVNESTPIFSIPGERVEINELQLSETLSDDRFY